MKPIDDVSITTEIPSIAEVHKEGTNEFRIAGKKYSVCQQCFLALNKGYLESGICKSCQRTNKRKKK